MTEVFFHTVNILQVKVCVCPLYKSVCFSVNTIKIRQISWIKNMNHKITTVNWKLILLEIFVFL